MTPTKSFEVITNGTQNRNSRLDQRSDGNDSLPTREWVEGLFLLDGRDSGREGQVERQFSAQAGPRLEARQGNGCEVPSSSSLELLPAHLVQQRMREPKELSPIEIEAFRPHKRQPDLGVVILYAFIWTCILISL